MPRTLPILLGVTAVLMGCSPAAPTDGDRSATSSAVSPAPSTGRTLPPVPRDSDRPTATPRPTRTESPADGSCGTVIAASGRVLRVMPRDRGTTCPTALRVVESFQRELDGRQPAGSRRPASATVEGWRCVSGPPSAHGGTTCEKDDETVFAAVLDEE